MTLPASLGAYQISGELGRGAMSVVYRASRGDREYAVKVMLSAGVAGPDPKHALQFRREAAALARLRHPSLVEVIELGDADGLPYLVMTLIEGDSLLSRLRDGPLEDAEVLALAIDVASALAEVHRHGLVHRDVKPANIVLGSTAQESGVRARLIDFGLVTSGESQSIAGTVQYAPPEQLGALPRPVGPTADLYALGATLFESLTGAPPFVDSGDGDFLHRLTATPAPLLTDVRPHTRPALSVVIDRLLSKDPDDRYPTARDLIRDLRRLDQLDETLRAGGAVRLAGEDGGTGSVGASSVRVEAPLVGRSREVAALEAEWARARFGALLFAQIRGEGGSGKSRLAREVVAAAEADGALLLAAKCQEADRTPFGPLREVADGLADSALRARGEDRAAQIAALKEAAGEGALLVGRLSTGLAALLGGDEAGLALEPGAEQQRFYAALADFLGRLGTPERPMLWLLDDVQWLDAGTEAVLSLLAASEHASYAMVLATARPNSSPIAARLQAAVDAVDGRGVPHFDLRPLRRSEVAAMAAAWLGERPLDDQVVDKLNAITRGNPFAVMEYLRALMDGGLLRPVGDRWSVPPDELHAIDLPDDVVELVIRRLDALDDETNALLSCAAVIGGRFTEDQLLAATDIDPSGLRRGMENMIERGLVERRPGSTLAFHHDRVREAVTERMDDEKLKDVHQALAEVLAAQPERSTRERYAMARHFARGRVEYHRGRAAAANRDGGLAALADHAYEDAFVMLDMARQLYGGSEGPGRAALLAALGRACAMTGRLDDAFTHLHAALPHVETTAERFSLEYLLTLTHAAQGQNDQGLERLYHAFEVLGSPYPRSKLFQALSLMWIWACVVVMTLTGWKAGSAEGEEAQRLRELSRLHYAGSMLALFDGDTFLTMQFLIRDFYNVHFLGPSAEKALATTNYGLLMGNIQLRGAMIRYTDAGLAMAEAVGDQGAVAICRCYRAMGYKGCGDLDRGTTLMLEALPQVVQDVPGSWYSSMMIAEVAYSFMHTGRAAAALELTARYMPHQRRTNNQLFTYNTMAVQHSALKILGQDQEAARLWGELEPHWQKHHQDLRLTRGQTRFEVLIDRRATTEAAVDDALPELEAQLGEDYYSLYAWELLGYARMIQYEDAPPERKAAARKKLRGAIINLTLRAMPPVFRCHPLIWRACIAREEGRHAAADRLLRKAEALLSGIDSPLGTFRAAEQRARLARDKGDAVAGFHAERALTVAESEGWVAKAAYIRTRFELAERSAASRGSRRAHGTHGTHSRRTLAPGIWMPQLTDRSARYADALLEVSLASASTLDVQSLADKALRATARVLGAERALFFLLDEQTGELSLEALTGDDAESISTTVVNEVLTTRAPVVLTGDADGQALASESILVHGLRSVMAVPLLFHDRLVGVVYVDNRLARGLFTDDDVALLLGLANHIAIAVENARAARGEAERAAMARDYELVGVVQTMFLPHSKSISLPTLLGESFWRPAAQCGGDWWWFEAHDDDALTLWMGDVNGHGAGPAMITSTISGAYHALRAVSPDAPPELMLEQLHQRIRALGGRFHMTMTAVRLDPARQQLTLWNAGGPPVFLQSGQDVRLLSIAGPVLGQSAGPITPAVLRAPLASGDRLLMCTDGILELDTTTSPRQLGAKGMVKLLRGATAQNLQALRQRLDALVDTRLSGREQPDDITALMVEVR